ncbi:MAG: DUF4358 domain-containing protein [Oscillospiraceae bacterium]|nr:DUF4358 domain-containing protein [Oscillospiraceae bacterium]
MKRAVSLLLSAALLLGLLSACQEPAPSGSSSALKTDWTAANLSEIAFQFSGFEESNEFEHLYIDHDRERLAAYIENAYGLEDWEDAAVSRAIGASAFEIAVLRMADSDAAVRAAAALMSYTSTRQGDFAGYAPNQADMAANGSILQEGAFVALFICPDPDGAYAAVEAALNGRTPAPAANTGTPAPEPTVETGPTPGSRVEYVQPGEDDMSLYDTSAIRTAWEKGDPAELSEYDRDIYDQAKEVLDKVLENGMSNYEKEVAVYSWMVQNVNYDWTHQDVMKKTPRESFTPYGGLVNHTAVCLGYATTFQLLMDLAGVECITVVGAAHRSSSDHGWNMVRLDGNWYCVDVTWDANMREMTGYGRQENWGYFNVTSDWMADTDHQWDYANIPEAVTEGSGRG